DIDEDKKCDAEEIKSCDETLNQDKPYEKMSVKELQAAVLSKLAANGAVTEQMKREVADNVYHDSLVNWVKSFR
ncbi:MAG: alpha-amylase, partial [Eubacteriales bacterium]|nr:alpha-amylase [Eubacteriales bacterium]